MKFDDIRRCAAAVREVPLETVLILRGAVRDRQDRSKWHTERGPLSVTGPKFMSWHRGTGGGGAIDLVMYLAGVDFQAAVAWLQQNVAGSHVMVGKNRTTKDASRKTPSVGKREVDSLRLPVRDDRMLSRVRRYLSGQRHLPASLTESLIASGKLYADSRSNAVFLLVRGKANWPVGAELRGTGRYDWRGMAPGTRKDLGYFWIGVQGSRTIILCESAIDAISCFHLHTDTICISTSGARANPSWLAGLIEREYQIQCGFDADEPGDSAAQRMIAIYPTITRLRPTDHDWNDLLAASR
jgi:hypothetical protein